MAPDRPADRSRRRRSDRLRRGRDRGQLLLVGAVAVALIILGLVVVYNTILFAGTQEPTQSLDDTSDSTRLRAQVVNDTQKLVNYVNNDTGFDCSSAPDFETAVEDNLTTLSNGLTYVNAKTGARYVGVQAAEADCGASAAIEVEMDLVIRTPETNYTTTIVEVYEPTP
jgi:Flp pilus assembly protein TadG